VTGEDFDTRAPYAKANAPTKTIGFQLFECNEVPRCAGTRVSTRRRSLAVESKTQLVHNVEYVNEALGIYKVDDGLDAFADSGPAALAMNHAWQQFMIKYPVEEVLSWFSDNGQTLDRRFGGTIVEDTDRLVSEMCGVVEDGDVPKGSADAKTLEAHAHILTWLHRGEEQKSRLSAKARGAGDKLKPIGSRLFYALECSSALNIQRQGDDRDLQIEEQWCAEHVRRMASDELRKENRAVFIASARSKAKKLHKTNPNRTEAEKFVAEMEAQERALYKLAENESGMRTTKYSESRKKPVGIVRSRLYADGGAQRLSRHMRSESYETDDVDVKGAFFQFAIQLIELVQPETVEQWSEVQKLTSMRRWQTARSEVETMLFEESITNPKSIVLGQLNAAPLVEVAGEAGAFMKALHAECRYVRWVVASLYPDALQQCVADGRDKPECTLLHYVLSSMEDSCLEALARYFTASGRVVNSLHFDGLELRRGAQITPQMLRDAEVFVEQTVGFNVSLALKRKPRTLIEAIMAEGVLGEAMGAPILGLNTCILQAVANAALIMGCEHLASAAESIARDQPFVEAPTYKEILAALRSSHPSLRTLSLRQVKQSEAVRAGGVYLLHSTDHCVASSIADGQLTLVDGVDRLPRTASISIVSSSDIMGLRDTCWLSVSTFEELEKQQDDPILALRAGTTASTALLHASARVEASKWRDALAKRGCVRGVKRRGLWACPMCPSRIFQRKQQLQMHVGKYHCEPQSGTMSSKQERVMAALWNDAQIKSTYRALVLGKTEIKEGNTYVERSARLILEQVSDSPSWSKQKCNLEKRMVWDEHIELLLDGAKTRFILKQDAEKYHKIGYQYVCTDAFLSSFLAALIHPDSKGARRRVLGIQQAGVGWARYLMPTFDHLIHSLAEALMERVELTSIKERARARADKTVLGIDGQYKPCMGVLYQTPHGQSINLAYKDEGQQGPSPDGASMRVMLTVQCLDSVLLVKPAPSEGFKHQIEALREATGEAGVSDVQMICSDAPAVLDKDEIYSTFGNLKCLAKDPIHVAIRAEMSSGEHRTIWSSKLRALLTKLKHGTEDSCEYYRAGGQRPCVISLNAAMQGTTERGAKIRVGRACSGHLYLQSGYTSENCFVKDIAALAITYPCAMRRRDAKGVTVLSSLTAATSPVQLGYLFNLPRFIARNPTHAVMYGTTRNEAFHAELKAFFRNIVKQTKRNAEHVASVVTLVKLVAGGMQRCALQRDHRQGQRFGSNCD
jgi:hypothetical protein